MDRPLLAAAAGDRSDAGILQLLDRGQEVVPVLDAGRVDAGFLEQRLVVVEADQAGLVGQGIDLALDRQAVDERRVVHGAQLAAIGVHRLGQVLDGAGAGLLGQHAAAPGVEQVRRIVRLQQRRQLGLERLVLKELHLDLDARMGGFKVLDDLAPGGADVGVGIQVEPFDRNIGERRAGRKRKPDRRAEERSERHRLSSQTAAGCFLPPALV